MPVTRPPLADAYDAACLATRAAWDRYEALEADYAAAFAAIIHAASHDELVAALATLAQLRGRLTVALDVITRLQRDEHGLYVQVMEWFAARVEG